MKERIKRIERIERNKELYEKYGKWVLLHNAWTGELPDEEERMFEFSVYDELPSGWAKAFGMEMIDELGKEIDKVGVRDKYYATQIKEKFGSLRWYDNGTTEEMDHIISKYSYLSSHICICCGRPDVGTTSGWITPMCEDCYGKTYHMKNKSPEEVHKAYIGEVGPYNYIEKKKGKDYYNFFNRMPNDYIVRQYGLDCSYEKVYDIHETADMIRRKWNDEHPDDTTPLSDNYIIPPLPKKKKKEKIKFDFL